MKKSSLAFSFALLFPFSFGWVGDIALQFASLATTRAYPVTVNSQDLMKSYQARKLTVLIVPGHDNIDPGAAFGDVSEADINLTMTKYLLERFGNDANIHASSARDVVSGDYSPEIKTYIAEEKEDIDSWSKILRALATYYRENNALKPEVLVHHNSANPRVARVLYGINRWANEHDIDVVLHVHFNDHTRRARSRPGNYSGFTIYAPHEGLPNGRASQELAQSIFDRLNDRFPVSDLPGEHLGVTPDAELIAVGANGSREKVSLLIEYGYIYESQFKDPEVRDKIVREMAYQTYMGVKDFFEAHALERARETTLIPYVFTRDLARGAKNDPDILHLQGALNAAGFYPPSGKTLNRCPINGSFGPCVERAVKSFQSAYGINTTGTVGPQTRAKLNERFSSSGASTTAPAE